MRLLFVMSVILQNGIIAVPNQPPELLEQYKEQQLHIQRLETAVQKLMDENENLNRKIDGLMAHKVVLYADMEDKIASQNDKIASQNDKIASQVDKIASQTDKIDIKQQKIEWRIYEYQNELTSKIDETAASVEEMKNTPKVAVAFRATCAENFPRGDATYKNLNVQKPVIWKNIEYNIGSAFNASNGRFTCPHDGIYSFYATSPVFQSDHGTIYIYINGSRKMQNWSNNDAFGHASPYGVVKLSKGDTVHINMVGEFDYAACSGYRCDCHDGTYFQGHLIDLL
jgi:hypothetical protein